jgi:hypothetical protein
MFCSVDPFIYERAKNDATDYHVTVSEESRFTVGRATLLDAAGASAKTFTSHDGKQFHLCGWFPERHQRDQ